MTRNLLLTPGPTQIPPDICAALGRPIVHHRTPQFQANLKEAVAGLQYVFQTQNDIYLLAASGTGAMEAAVANIVSPGDKVITVEGGKFGERWTEICLAYNARPEAIKIPWNTSVTPDQIRDLLKVHRDVKAVFITLCETSTGVTTDVQAIAEVVKQTKSILVVDAISGLGVSDFQMDRWSVDVAVSASHKGFMLPPGLAFVAANAKAIDVIQKSTSPRYYFDLRKSKKALAKTDTPFTPAIGIIIALTESLRRIQSRGLENLFEHFALLARATRAAARAIGLTMYPDESCMSNALTTINVPEGVDGAKLVKTMRDTYGVVVAGGQGELTGKIVRVAHMGCLTQQDTIDGIECLQTVLKEMGYSFSPGAGVSAAQKIFEQSPCVT